MKLKYNWSEVQKYYDNVKSVRKTIRFFGMSHQSWNKAKKVGRIITRDNRIPIETLLSRKTSDGRTHRKQRLIRDGYLIKECYICFLKDWLNKPISLQIDHINGDSTDWRLENLRLLCPNCHSQTDTFSGRNNKKITESSNR